MSSWIAHLQNTRIQIVMTYFVVILSLLSFQNCSPVAFEAKDSASLKEATLDDENNDSEVNPLSKTCDEDLRPIQSETLSCPMGASGSGVIRNRTVSCHNGIWTVGVWGGLNYSGCTCSQGKEINLVSGQCACSGNQIENSSGQCVASTCQNSNRPIEVETSLCSSGSGNRTRTRTVSCTSGAWTVGQWSIWNESACSSGPTQCSQSNKPVSTQTLQCNAVNSSSSGSVTQTRTVTCNTNSGDWVAGNFSTPDYSICTCAIQGQLSNSSGVCSCPSGQSVINGRCSSGTSSISCSLANKPLEQRNVLCNTINTQLSGSITQNRTVTCNTTNGTWTASDFPAVNYSTCSCPYQGQTANEVGVCGCPASQVLIQSANACGTCGANQVYNSNTKLCESLTASCSLKFSAVNRPASTSINIAAGKLITTVLEQTNTTRNTFQCVSPSGEVTSGENLPNGHQFSISGKVFTCTVTPFNGDSPGAPCSATLTGVDIETVRVSGNQGTRVAQPSTATCPSGYHVIGGGYQFNGSNGCGEAYRFDVESYPSALNSWTVKMECSNYTAFAICAKGSNAELKTRIVQGARGEHNSRTGAIHPSTATCNTDEAILSGGFKWDGSSTAGGCGEEHRFVTVNYPGPNRDWTVAMECSYFNAYAVCGKIEGAAGVWLGNDGIVGASGQNSFPSINIPSVASCKEGYKLAGGGLAWDGSFGCGEEHRFATDSRPDQSSESWIVNMQCSKFRSVAVCIKTEN